MSKPVQVLIEVEQLHQFSQEFLVKLVSQIKPELNLNYWEEPLTVEGVADDLKVSKDSVYNWRKKKKDPMIFKGHPGRITRKEARDWFNTYSNNFEA